MPRSLMRVALVAGLMLGIIAMHSFGHASHDEDQSAVTAHAAHHGHTMNAEPASDEDDDRSALLSALGLMACGAVLARFAFDWLRPSTWSQLWRTAAAAIERICCAPTQVGLPPPLVQPTGVTVNRIALLRI
ncbi:hypothetical protein AB0K52_24000 [Glycomyces sp. NPDC049804]|uniref:hypothetical protein n=1 Tax=Glycomyces sp. NPDC049804 TaxID=3154363 RepID=UPI00343B9870